MRLNLIKMDLKKELREIVNKMEDDNYYSELANNLTDEVVNLRIVNEKIKVENEKLTEQLRIGGVSGSTFTIEELHVLHSGLIAGKPRLNEKTRGYKETLKLIDKLSLMIGEYYR